MPIRSNAFQRLVRAIQGHLSRSGTVTESRILQDRDTGADVEVDIVIEEVVGSHCILVGIECTSTKRKATVEWYREMRAKHADLPISKTVLVSESGFTGQVHRKALKDNVTLLTIGEAHSFEWKSLFSKLRGGTIADVRFALREISVKFSDPIVDKSSLQIGPDDVVKLQGTEMPLRRLVLEAARGAGLTRRIMSNLGEVMKRTDHFNFTFRVPEDTHIVHEGRSFTLTEVAATMSIHPRYESVEWRPVDFNGQAVATGTFPADFLFPGENGDTVVTVSKDSEDLMKISLLSPADRDIPLDVFPHALWRADADHSSDN